MMDVGAAISYLALDTGTPVLSRDGERIGAVEHVLCDPDADLFEGLVVDTRAGPGGWRFADVSQIESIHERAVRLAVDSAAAEQLPEPSEHPAEMAAGPDETVPDDLRDRLRRAWDWISGNY